MSKNPSKLRFGLATFRRVKMDLPTGSPWLGFGGSQRGKGTARPHPQTRGPRDPTVHYWNPSTQKRVAIDSADKVLRRWLA